MTNSNLQNLPPELQARIASIVEQAGLPPAAMQQQAPAPIIKPPSLMDHTIALRQEVAALSQQVAAIGQVVEACGQATGALYQMFQEQTSTTNYGGTNEESDDF